jgi:hypothetical protein
MDQSSDVTVAEQSPGAPATATRDGSPAIRTLLDFWNAQAEWSQATFGTDAERGPIGALKHLRREADDLMMAVEPSHRAEEVIDCLFLTFDAARRSGYTFNDVYDSDAINEVAKVLQVCAGFILDNPTNRRAALKGMFWMVTGMASSLGMGANEFVGLAFQKLEINKARLWPAISEQADDAPILHTHDAADTGEVARQQTE